MKVFYVYVRNGHRVAYPVGPFPSKEDADPWVDPAQRYVDEHVDSFAGFYEWGVAGVELVAPPLGRFNAKVGYTPLNLERAT